MKYLQNLQCNFYSYLLLAKSDPKRIYTDVRVSPEFRSTPKYVPPYSFIKEWKEIHL
jgi:hypothetical protein